jgi:DeoR family transcriptional regulator, suf operon transcriptional repressor
MEIRSSRDKILQTLLNHPRSSISHLAQQVGINAISVRHHLTALQADGLVTAEEERHGVGRPRLVYRLTEKGLEHFPTRYFRLTNRLLDQMHNTLPDEVVHSLFDQMAVQIASSYTQKAKFLTIEEKLELIKQALADEGFLVEWEKQGDTYRINEITCPYFHIGQSHPEVCNVDRMMISTVLAVPVEKITCVLQGDAHCTYVIQNPDLAEKQR